MKKNYMQPNTIIVNIRMHSLLSNSPGSTPGLGGTTSNTSDLLSRERGWDDDEEDW